MAFSATIRIRSAIIAIIAIFGNVPGSGEKIYLEGVELEAI
ncbi:MAG: hypothetical protein P8L70_14945 [Halioglobus sp.]|nr:hypothetical protein [Halioglobus sp.]